MKGISAENPYKVIKVEARDVEPGERPVIYFFEKGENVLENLQKRRDRPYVFYKELLPYVLKKAKIKLDIEQLNWRQNAGCQCGCSPGFVGNELKKDIFVDVQIVK